jgi:hypothetical protein
MNIKRFPKPLNTISPILYSEVMCMKKLLISLIVVLSLFATLAAADAGDMMGWDCPMCGMMMGPGTGYGGGMYGLFGLVYIAIASFIFSVIFWLTKNWLVKEKRKRR